MSGESRQEMPARPSRNRLSIPVSDARFQKAASLAPRTVCVSTIFPTIIRSAEPNIRKYGAVEPFEKKQRPERRLSHPM